MRRCRRPRPHWPEVGRLITSSGTQQSQSARHRLDDAWRQRTHLREPDAIESSCRRDRFSRLLAETSPAEILDLQREACNW